jgi:sigma-B regulation protein RsbU (phosphoserine phosphatase)
MDMPLPGADQLYQEAPCGLLLASGDGRILQVNRTLCAWMRCEPGDMVERMRFPDLLTMGGRIFWQTHLQPLLRIQASVAEVKLELRRQDKSTIPVMVNIAERPWQKETLLHVAVFMAEDRHKYERELLLQRKRAEELAAMHARDQQALAAAQEQAEDRAKFAEHLVGMVSHDIRNPLSVIHMSAVLLERGVSPEQQVAATQRISRAVSRVQHLIGDLLDFTQARLGGGISMRRADVDLHQVVADAVSELAVGFPSSTLRHERSGSGLCHADAQRIAQALGNLVANAVAHGDPSLPIVIRSEAREGAFVIGVRNQGRPIPPEVIPRLFEPMVRGEHAGSQGVGLGLFIVGAIVRAHGGQVEVQSTAELGTTFSMRLPCSG